MITASQARSMAETLWGRGGTHSTRTNRKGCFYYSCSSHGGFVIDARALSISEYSEIRKFIESEYALEVRNIETGKLIKFRGPHNHRTVRYYTHTQVTQDVPIIFAEEDCAWSVIYEFTDIRINNIVKDKTFFNWYDTANPVVIERKRQDLARKNKDPNLIISARRQALGIQITCADMSVHHLDHDKYDNSIKWLDQQ